MSAAISACHARVPTGKWFTSDFQVQRFTPLVEQYRNDCEAARESIKKAPTASRSEEDCRAAKKKIREDLAPPRNEEDCRPVTPQGPRAERAYFEVISMGQGLSQEIKKMQEYLVGVGIPRSDDKFNRLVESVDLATQDLMQTITMARKTSAVQGACLVDYYYGYSRETMQQQVLSTVVGAPEVGEFPLEDLSESPLK